MSRFTMTAGAAIAAAALLSTGATGVFAAKGTAAHAAKAAKGGKGVATRVGAGMVAYGTLTTLNAGSAVVATPSNGSLTVTLAAGATYTARSQAAATAGLKTGDQVALRGTSVNGAVTARAVIYDTTPFAIGAAALTGTVASSTPTSLSVTTAAGKSVTVQLTGTTRYRVGGKAAASAPTFTANERVQVVAQLLTDGTVVARVVATKAA
jgi:hypothetical protein